MTFLLTDIEGSTRSWEEFPAEMERAVEEHDVILRRCVEPFGGFVFSTQGDAFAVAFSDPADAMGAALASQHELRTRPADISRSRSGSRRQSKARERWATGR